MIFMLSRQEQQITNQQILYPFFHQSMPGRDMRRCYLWNVNDDLITFRITTRICIQSSLLHHFMTNILGVNCQ